MLSHDHAICWVFDILISVLVIGTLTESNMFRENLQRSHIPTGMGMPESKEHKIVIIPETASLSRGYGPGTPAGDPGRRRWCSLLQMELLTSQCRMLPQECGVIDL